MADRPRGRGLARRLAVATAMALTAACAPPSSPSGPAPAPPPAAVMPAPPPEALLDAYARLIRLEDRREFDHEMLQRLAGDDSARVRARTALALARLRDPSGARLLLHLLADADTAVAATAAFGLGQLADSMHASAVAAPLSMAASAPTVASEAAHALGRMGGAAAREALFRLLRDAPLEASSAAPAIGSALLAIWKLPPLPSLEPIARWLGSLDPSLRWRAAYALVRRPDTRALPLLRGALQEDSDPRVRALALRGLTASAADSAGIDRAALVREIVPSLADADYAVAINAARVLGGYSEGGAVDALSGVVTSPRRHLALAAIESLGRIGAEARSAEPALAAIAGADSLPVALRAAAMEALATINHVAATQVAAALAIAPAWRLRAAAARAYAAAQGPVGPELRERISDPDPRVANAALLAAIDAAEDDLLPLRPLLLEQLGARDVIVRSTALTALSRSADPSLLSALLDAYDRARADTLNDAALAAVDAIAATGSGSSMPQRAFLARFPRSPDALVRLRAVQRFDSAAVVAAWGEPLPVETGRDGTEYREVVDRLVAPALAGASLPTVSLVTRGDTIRLRLFPLEATLTVENVLRLADAAYFDGQEWPRIVPNFVVQGGDPRGDTSGGPGYTIRDEISRHRYGVGSLGMALAGPDTGGSQFFVTHSPQPHLDGTYAIFGEVAAGRQVTEELLPGDLIDSIRSLP